MENRLNPAGEGESQKKEWYKKWWGVIIALVIWPLFAIWYISQKTKWNNTTKGFTIIGVIILAVLIYGGDKSENKQAPNKEKVVAETNQPQQPTEEKAVAQETKTEAPQVNTAENNQSAQIAKQPEIKIPKYEIVYEVTGKRYDGAKIYYVLIDPINLKDDSFKNDIKTIIKKITEEKGAKISIDIFDKKTVLESSYNEASTQKIPSAKENIEAETHYIAMFSGELKTNIYPNTLSFFGSTFTDNKTVGKYVETIEFNPSQN
jgi:hypothetical protein